MNKFKNHQHRPRKDRFDIVGHKKALSIWRDSTFNPNWNWMRSKLTSPTFTSNSRKTY